MLRATDIQQPVDHERDDRARSIYHRKVNKQIVLLALIHMATEDQQPRAALAYEVIVGAAGKIELSGPFFIGEPLTVIVIRDVPRDVDHLVAAASSTLDFWDNPLDDDDWNEYSATPRPKAGDEM